MRKITRSPTRATGGITPEERNKIDAISRKWTQIAFRTSPIEREKIVPAIQALYAAAGLKKPRVVIAPSPLVMAFAYGASAAIWHTRNATDSATYSATYSATSIATHNATHSATLSATDSATHSATYSATHNATHSATHSATSIATHNATSIATHSATHSATSIATHNATSIATRSATHSATSIATHNATHNATHSATRSATDNATRSATHNATHSATRSATRSATDNATRSATHSATSIATEGAADACRSLAGEFGIQCAQRWYNVSQGGNMWAAFPSYVEACRDVLGLKLPEFEAWQAWEDCAREGGYRVLHPEFCIVSDFPEFIQVDDKNRPHCETGPSHRWRDGWSLYHWHGVRIPDHWIEQRQTLDPNEVIRAQNVELRAAGAAIIGLPRMRKALKARVIDGDPSTTMGALIEMTLPGLPEPGRFLEAVCPRNGTIIEGVPHVSDIDRLPINTALAAQAWRIGDPQAEYIHPPQRT